MVVPVPMPERNLFDEDLQNFAVRMVNVPSIPPNQEAYPFELCLKKSISNELGILQCVATTHLEINGYVANDLRSDCIRVLEELPEKHWLIFHYADMKKKPAGRKRRLSFSTGEPVDGQNY